MNVDLSNKDITQLLEIIENSIDYQEDYVNQVKKELDLRDILLIEKHKIAISIYEKKLKGIFETNLFSAKNYKLPNSEYLSEKEKLKLFKEAFGEYMSKRRMLNSRLDMT